MSVSQTFRQTFKLPQNRLNWYPGHMAEALSKMQEKLRNIDCVIEVHDARVAISGRNPVFVKKLVGLKPHILVLNKSDLIEKADQKLISAHLKYNHVENVLFTNCLHEKICPGIKRLIPLATDLILNSPRFNRVENMDLTLMVIGIPNVGKSSLINVLRNSSISRSSATAVGPKAGVTKSVLNKIKVNVNPLMYLIDTPGILSPNVTDNEVLLKLALCSCFKDRIVSNYVMADFLLYWLNKVGNFSYVHKYELGRPQDEILPVLAKIAHDFELFKNTLDVAKNKIRNVPDIESAASVMVEHFRQGEFGFINMDKALLM